MKHAGGFSGGHIDSGNAGLSDHAFVVPDAHLLFSGEFQRSGRDLVISDASHRVVVRDYFQNKHPPQLVSPEGALLDPKVIEALTGHIEVAQAGGASAGKVVGQIVKMTGSASVVRNGVTIVLNVGDTVYRTDVVQTGSGSTLGLVLEDGTAFNLSANARLMLNDLTYDANSSSNASFITLIQGAANFVAGQVARTGDMQVATPTAVIGIRGTAVKLDISSTDGRIDISVIDQQDGQVHAVDVFRCVPTGVTDPQTGATCRAGDRLGTISSNGPSLSLTPTANFDVVVQQVNKTPVQITQESQAYQGLQSTYDAGRQINPNLPQHTQNDTGGGDKTGTDRATNRADATDKGGDNNATPRTATATSSTPANPPGTEIKTLTSTTVANVDKDAVVTVTVASQTTGSSGASAPASAPPAITTTPFVVTLASTPGPTAPVIGTVKNDVSSPVIDNGFSSHATLTITGTAEAGSTVTVYDSDGTTVVGSGVATSAGSYAITTAALSEGSHTLTAKATDSAGQQGTASTAFHVTIDTSPPNAPVIGAVTDHTSTIPGTVADNGFTNDTTLTFAGTAENGATVTIYDTDGTTIVGTGVATGGSYSIKTAPLGEGSHVLTAKATDAAGNQGAASTAFHVTIDITAPNAPSIISVTDDVPPLTGPLVSGGSTNDSDLTVRVGLIGTNAVAGDSIQLYNGTGTGSPLGTSHTLTPFDIATGFVDLQTGTLNNGVTYAITARVSDQAGNKSSASGDFIVKTAPSAPSIGTVTDDVSPVTGPVADNGFSNDTTLTITGTAEAGSTVTIYDTDGTTVLGTGVATGGNYSITTSVLSEGSHTLTARATDTAGIEGPASAAFHVTIDTTAPFAPLISAVTDDVPPVTGPVADNGFSNDTTLTITGTAEAGSTVTIYDTDGTTVVGSGVATGGTFSITTSALTQGTHTLTARATDTAGNQSTASTAFHVTIDTTAPAAPVISTVTDDVPPQTGTVVDNGFSNDTTLTIAGTAEAGSTVTIYDTDGTTVLGTGVATGGSFSITTSALTQGTHTLTAKATDAAGNQGAASAAFHVTIDTTAPAAPVIGTVTDDLPPITGPVADNGFSNDTTLTITGTAEAGSTVTIYDTDGTTVVGSGVATGGSFSITTSALTQGTHTLIARATDAAGNQGAASTAFHVTIDTTAPAAPSITSVTDDVAPVTGPLTSGDSTNDPDLTVRVGLIGTNAVAGDSIQLYNGTGTASPLGTSHTLTLGDITNGFADLQTGTLSNGVTYTITARVTDQAGNQSAASGSFVVTETGTAPSAPSITSVTDDVAPVTGTLTSGGSTNDPDLMVRVGLIGTNAVAGDSIQLYNGTGTGSPLGTSHTLTLGDISNGFADVPTGALSNGVTYTITARVTDQAGNQSAASGSFIVTEDTSAPSAPVIGTVTDDVPPQTGPVADNGFSNDTTLTIAGTAEAGSTVTIYDTDGTTVLGTGVATAGSFSITTSALTQGTHTLTARATDAAGNQSAASTAFHVTIDTTAPSAPVIGTVTDDVPPQTGPVADNGFSNDTTLTITGSAEAGSTVTIYDSDGTTIVGSGVATGGSFSITTSALSLGAHTLTARATDAAGNQSAASTAFHVTIDTTAPAAPVIGTVTDDVPPQTGPVADNGFSNDTTLTITGSAEAGSTVTIYDSDGTTIVGSGVATGGSFSITTSALGQGTHTLTARATDAAGNQSTASTAFHVTIDTTAPAAPVIGTVTDDVPPQTGPVADNGFSNDTTLTITGTAEAGSTVTIYDTDGTTVLGTGVATGGSFSITTSALSQGTHTLTARATDAAGNQSAASTAFHVTIDTTAPAAPVIGTVTDDVPPQTGPVADNGFSNDTTLTIAGTAEAGSTVTIYDTDGTTVLGTGVATGGSFSITTSALSQGTHTLTARATDAAGNQSAASTAFHVTIDTTAPSATATITSISESPSPTSTAIIVSGTNDTLAAGEKVQISADGVTWTDVTQVSLSRWSFTDATARSANFTYFTRIVDLAGNTGTTTAQAVLVARNGATISTSGSSPVTVQFTGTGGTLQIAAAGSTATIAAIAVVSGGAVAISGSGNVTTTVGDAIDLDATGAPQASPDNLTVNPSGTITGAGNGIVVTQNAAGSITVTATGSVTGLAGRGIYAEQTASGTGAILINGSGSVTGTGAAFSGILAQNLNSSNNSDVTVSQTGNISGGKDAIRAQTNSNGNINITTGAGANITGSTLYGIEAIANGSGSISVTTAAGTVINSAGAGINAYNQASSITQGANSVISVTANGTINSGTVLTGSGARPAGILATYRGGSVNTNNPNVFGNVIINNFATIQAAGGDGIRGSNYGNGNITISSASAIVARDIYGINGNSFGGGSIAITTTAGSSITSGSHGILALNLASAIVAGANSTITVTAAGTINAGVHLTTGGATNAGISAGYFGPAGSPNTAINGTVLVDNAANITARSSQGIIAFNVGYGNITVTDRTGTSVNGAQFGIAASSSVNGTGSPSDIVVTIEGNAAVTAGSLNGIAAVQATNTSGGNITITTGAGDQFKSGGTGINANSAATSVAAGKQISVTTATGTINSGFNFFTNGSTPSGIGAGYSIGTANYNANVHGNVVLDNSATVIAAAGPGINLYNSGNGAISATLRSTSSITSLQAGGITVFSAAGGAITINNQGTINAAAIGISANNGSGPSANGLISISNSGTINAPGVPYIPVVAIGNGNSTTPATVSNSAGHSIASSLFGRTTNNFAISFNAGNGSVTNNGTITGNVTFAGNGSFTNNGTWNTNGSNNFGSGSTSNAGTINASGITSLSALSNTGSIFVAANSSALLGNLTGTGTITLADRSGLELGSSVAATQTINLAGKGLLTFDSPASVGSNLPINFTSNTNGNVGSVITLQGAGITAANISGGTLTVTGAQNYLFNVSGAGLSGNMFDVLSPNRIVLVPTTATVISGVTTPQSPPTPASFYILDNDHITGSGPGFNLQTTDGVAANTYAIVANATSDISVSGSNIPGLRVATQGASAVIINAANIAASGTGTISGIVVDTTLNGNIGTGTADIINYGNASGATNAIFAGTVNGNVNIFTGPATLTGTSSYGIFGRANGNGAVTIFTSSGGTISGGIAGILALSLQATPSAANVQVYNWANVTGGANNATANVANSGAGAIRAGILNNNTSTPNAAITGDVIIESRGTVTALFGSGLYAFNYGSGNTSVTLAPGQTITAANGIATGVNSGLTQYGIFAFNYGSGSSLANVGWNTTITSGSSAINVGNQATAIAAASGSTVSVYSQGFISSGSNVNNSGTAPAAIQAGYNPGAAGAFSSAVYGNVIVNVAGVGGPTTTIVAAAGSGINAYNYAVGNVTVSVGSGVSIQAMTAATSALGGNAAYGVSATNRGSGNIFVTTLAGSSISAGSSGINAVNDSNPTDPTAGPGPTADLANLFAANFAAGKPAVVAVTAAGTIQSGSQVTNSGNPSSGISAGFFGNNGHANQYVIGDVFINNAATMGAASYGIQGYNFGYGSITINDAPGATIVAGLHGIYAHAEGGFTNPLSSGAPTRDIAINVYGTSTAPTKITAGSAATPSNPAYGIFALSTNAGSISITTTTNSEIDTQASSAGINAVNEASSIALSDNSSVVVNNSAKITSGTALTGFSNQPAGILAGYIGGTTNPAPNNLANYNVHGEVAVYNFGNITANAGYGINAYTYGVGNVTVNNFAGTIKALGAGAPNGSDIGILAQNYGPGDLYVTTSASTTILSGGSGIAAINKAISGDPLNPSVVVPTTSQIIVNASGVIQSGTTLTGTGEPPAGILAGYNPNNLNTANNGVHGSVSVDSHATILAPSGTDGIRAVNFGDGDIKVVVESDSDVMAGRYGVAALGSNGGDVNFINNGSVFGGTAAVDAITTAAGTVTIDNTGFLGGLVFGYNATFTNEAGGDWQFSGTSTFSGTGNTLINAGTIETTGVSAITGLSSFTNTGLIAVDSAGTLTINAPMTGGGTALLYDATLVLNGASDANVQFANFNSAIGSKLVLSNPGLFTGTVTGFTSNDQIDLAGIAPGSVSVTNDGGFLHVNFAGGSFQLLGNYNPGGFSIGTDGGTGTFITWNHVAPSIDTTQFTLSFDQLTGKTTINGLHVTDSDPAGSLGMTMTATTTSGVGTATPILTNGSLSALNLALNNGVTYDPTATPAQKEMITMIVTDSFGASDEFHFIFTPGTNNGNGATLQGTSGNDVIFATGGSDTLIGGAGRDQFVFGPSSATSQDVILDFVEGIDRIDLRQYNGTSNGTYNVPDITSANIQSLIQAAQTAQANGTTGNDTLLTLDSGSGHMNTVLLKNVLATSLQATDFILHA